MSRKKQNKSQLAFFSLNLDYWLQWYRWAEAPHGPCWRHHFWWQGHSTGIGVLVKELPSWIFFVWVEALRPLKLWDPRKKQIVWNVGLEYEFAWWEQIIVVMFFFHVEMAKSFSWSQQHGATSFLLTVFETRIRSQHWKRLAFGSPGIYRKKKHGWAPNFQYNGRNGLQTSWGLGHQLSCWAGYHYGQGNGSGWKEMTESSRRLTTTSERKPWSMTSSLRWMCF